MFRLLLVLLALGTPALAQLKWDKPWQEFHRAPEDEKIETTFAFRNAGATRVTVKSIKTSCGCTAARLERKVYEPGETGEVSARFNFGGRKGAHRKLITVKTDDGAVHELNLVVFIHPVLNVAPSLVFWRVGQPADARVVQLTAEQGTRVNVKGVTSSNPRVTATLRTVKPGEEYALNVVPADTATRESAELTVQTDYPPDAPKALKIFARIK